MTSWIAMCVWAVATMCLAPLPIRYQMWPGLVSLIAFPVLLIWLGRDYGAVPVVICCLAAVSLFRKPLGALGHLLKSRLMRPY